MNFEIFDTFGGGKASLFKAKKGYAAFSINTEKTSDFKLELRSIDLGLIDYYKAWKFQKEAFKAVKYGYINSALILCQHFPVITLGRSGDKKNILVSGEQLEKNSISLFSVERGGDITYHGPGQITVYPIINLNFFKKDIHWYLRQLEQIVIELLSDFGIEGKRKSGFTGVWIGNKKIASIGIAIRNWITFHGLSINIKQDDLENFKLIRPCGLDIEMTSLEAQLINSNIDMKKIRKHIIHKFRNVLGFDSSDTSALKIRIPVCAEEEVSQ